MRLLVTRPEPDGERTAGKLRARGHDVLVAPLLRIRPVDADIGNGPWSALALTSLNAVRAVAQHPRLASLQPLPVFAVGRRTAEAARAAGFASVTSADGNLNDLARLIAARHAGDGTLLHPAGEDRAGDLSGSLAATGIMVQTVVLYRAVMVDDFPVDVRERLVSGRVDGVLHFSRRSAESYLACARAGGILSAALAPSHFCLSQAVADPLAAANASRIRVADEPSEAALMGLIDA